MRVGFCTARAESLKPRRERQSGIDSTTFGRASDKGARLKSNWQPARNLKLQQRFW